MTIHTNNIITKIKIKIKTPTVCMNIHSYTHTHIYNIFIIKRKTLIYMINLMIMLKRFSF